MKTEQSFSPITITLESVTELDWLRAISNVSITEAEVKAERRGITIRGTFGEINAAQMALFNALEDIQR